MKTIEVVAAIIIKDGLIFATQRGYGEHKGLWEFPGGKIEAGESHEASRWLTKETLNTVNWLPADLVLLDKISELI